MAGTMRLEVNGETTEVHRGTTVADVVRTTGAGSRGVAVAVNSQLVRKVEWGSLELADGDRVEVLQAVAGG